MIKFTLNPCDVLFFGSGKPFNRGDVVNSIFPPHPTTFSGAVCSKICSYKNIKGASILKAVYGPFVEKQGKIYFPKPQNIYGERKKRNSEKFFIVKPFDEGKLKLFKSENTNKPQIKTFYVYKGTEEVESFKGFISPDGLKKWLNDREVDEKDILLFKDIFENESRIGISIDPSIYSVGGKEDALYRIEFLRLKEDVRFVFWVDFNFSDEELEKVGLNNEGEIIKFFNNEPRVLKLGGEMRNVRYEVEKDDFKKWIINELKVPEKIDLDKGEKILVLFLTYGVFDFKDDKLPKIEDFQIYSACFGNYEIIGINSKNLGIKTKRAFPAGTVVWLETQNSVSISNPVFIVKNQDNYYFGEPKGKQDFIGANLVLIKKEAKNV